MEEIKLRPATLNDIDSIYNKICELEEERFDKKTFEGIFKENLNNKNIHYIVAEHQNNVAGFISLHIQNLLHHNGKAAEIQELFVDLNLRDKGVGAKLVNYAKQIAVENKCKIIEVTSNSKRIDTHRFYEREGLIKTHYKFTQKLD